MKTNKSVPTHEDHIKDLQGLIQMYQAGFHDYAKIVNKKVKYASIKDACKQAFEKRFGKILLGAPKKP